MLPPHAVLNCGGGLTLTNGGSLSAYGAVTNGATAPYGSLVSVTGRLTVASGSWVYPHSAWVTNEPGGPPQVKDDAVAVPLFRMTDLVVSAGGGFHADAKGFAGGWPLNESGYGPGKGLVVTYYGGGAGHGGAGGNGSNGAGGSTYNSSNAPVRPGSGGGGTRAGAGGGGIRIDVDGVANIAGTLAADGADGASHGGGGAGGSVFVMCRELEMAPTTVLAAQGGNAGQVSGKSSGGGGDGRITVAIGLSEADRQRLLAGDSIPGLSRLSQYSPPTATVTATNGINATYPARDGHPGTIAFLTTSKTLTILGLPDEVRAPSPQTYGSVPYAGTDTWITNNVVTPADEAAGSRWACRGWTLAASGGAQVDSGAGTQAVVHLTNNMDLTWSWTNEYQLTVLSSSPSNGSVNATRVNGWYTNGLVVTGIIATASNGYMFSEWTGDVPAGHENDNPLTVAMDQARSLTAAFASAGGVSKTWTGDGLWETSGNWSPPGMPGPMDDATVASGTVLFGNVRELQSLTIASSATMVFTNWNVSLTASNITVETGGAITLPAAFTDGQPSNRVVLICSNFTLEAGATIDAAWKGFAGAAAYDLDGNGPGKGLAGTGYYGGGAGHGGPGGDGRSGRGGGGYDSTNAPASPGSGGGGTGAGSGGGAVVIAAGGTVTIDGTVNANGKDTTAHGGGGSGGSIFVTCAQLEGDGLLTADGGDTAYISNGSGGGGAAGRIAVIYTQAGPPRPGLRFSTSPGSCGVTALPGAPGSVYLPDNTFLSETMANFLDVRMYGMTNWAGSHLALTNRVVRLAEEGFALTVTNDILCAAASGLELPEHVSASVGGDLALTDAAYLAAYAGITNASSPEHGALVSIAGDITIASGSWIYPYAHRTSDAGGAVLFRAHDLTVATNAGFMADELGYAGGRTSSDSGYGPGRGLCGPSAYYGGGGAHGGAGGNGTGGAGGAAYDRTNAPVKAGSGGGGLLATAGGGSVWIEATGDVALDGSITADSANGTANGGGGAGGSIFITCRAFAGGADAVLSARGGNAGQKTSATAGAGAGGRIAVWYGPVTEAERLELLAGRYPPRTVVATGTDTFLGGVSATNGINAAYASRNGEAGSIAFVTIPPPGGTLVIVR